MINTHQNSKGKIMNNNNLRRISAGSLVLAMAALQIVPAFATIDNTVTAKGKDPSNVDIINTATAAVDVADASPKIKVVEIATLADTNGNGKADPGEVITYSYVVTNTGNVTLKDVLPTETNDGAGTPPVMVVPGAVTTDNGSLAAGTLNDSSDSNTADNKWGILGPGDVITFKSTYIVTATDIANLGGGTGIGLSGFAEADSFLDDKISVTGDYNNGVTTTSVTATDRDNTPLNIVNALVVTKTPDISSNVAAGQTVTYTYTVTNSGTTPITAINLVDSHNASGPAPTPAFVAFTTNLGGSTNSGNTITKLMPGDVAKYTATYIVTQADVDALQ
jgi:hypothetical protein